MTLAISPTLDALLDEDARARAMFYLRELEQAFLGRPGLRHAATVVQPRPERKSYGFRERLGVIEDWLVPTAPASEHVFRQFGWLLPDFEVSELCGRMVNPQTETTSRAGELREALLSVKAELQAYGGNADTVLCGLNWLGEAYRIAAPPAAGEHSHMGDFDGLRIFTGPGIPHNNVYVFAKNRVTVELDSRPDARLDIERGMVVLEVRERFGIPPFDQYCFKARRRLE